MFLSNSGLAAHSKFLKHNINYIPGSLDCWYMCCIAVPKIIFIIF